MYNYEVIVNNQKIKTNDLNEIIKILKYLIENNYKAQFISNYDNVKLNIEDIFDIAMIEDNLETKKSR